MTREIDEKPTVEKDSSLDSGTNDGQEVPPNCSSSRKLRILCLHGFRTSGKIMAQQLAMADWAPLIDDITELVFMDGPCPATGLTPVEKRFEGPYFEWHHLSENYKEVDGLDKAAKHFSDHVSLHGPFDGLLRFSQGALLAAAWMGFYERGDSMGPNMSSIKFFIIVSGGRHMAEKLRHAYSDTINCPSLHLIGDKCFLKPYGEALVPIFKDPIVIRHPFGHFIPRLGAGEGQIVRDFLLKQFQSVSSNGNYPRPVRLLL